MCMRHAHPHKWRGAHGSIGVPRICALVAAVAAACAGRTRKRSSKERQTIIQTIARAIMHANRAGRPVATQLHPSAHRHTLQLHPPFCCCQPLCPKATRRCVSCTICDSRIIHSVTLLLSLQASLRCAYWAGRRAARAGRQGSDVYPILSPSAVAL